jgi:integrase
MFRKLIRERRCLIPVRDGGAYRRSGIGSALERAAEAAGYTTRSPGAKHAPASGLTAKDLRPFAAKAADKQGYTLEQLKIALAHTSVTTTEGYVRQHTTPTSAITLRLPARPAKNPSIGPMQAVPFRTEG